jgi:aminomethyltransferase
MAKTTPLYEVHRGLGASFTEFAGWSMPVRYTSETAEHRVVRTAAGIFDLSHMGEVELAGEGAAAALDTALVGCASRIAVGRAKYSMICAEDGGIIDDLVVYRLTNDRFLIVANAANVETVAQLLQQRASGHAASTRDVTQDWSLIAVQGPASEAIVSAVSDVAVTQLRYYAISARALCEAEVLVARTGYTGEDGFEIYCRPVDAPQIWDGLLQAGAEHGLVPAGLAARDSLRLEAGMPLYGHELSRKVTPVEAGLSRVIAFDKGCPFVGEEQLQRRLDDGPRRVLVGLSTRGRRPPRPGYAVVDVSNTVVGEVTSGGFSPTLRRSIAIAYVTPTLTEPGTRLKVDVRGSLEDAEITALPFYQR